MSVDRQGIVFTEETELTEITLQPDGRIYVFGASRDVLEVMNSINPRDAHVRAVLDCVRQVEAAAG